MELRKKAMPEKNKTERIIVRYLPVGLMVIKRVGFRTLL